MWILPDNEKKYAAFKKISEDIESNNGETLLDVK